MIFAALMNFGCLSSGRSMSFGALKGLDPLLDFARKERRADAEDQTEEPEDIDCEKRSKRAVLIP